MKERLCYLAPQTCWCELAAESLVCDSYNSGIDNYDYEEIDWTVKP